MTHAAVRLCRGWCCQIFPLHIKACLRCVSAGFRLEGSMGNARMNLFTIMFIRQKEYSTFSSCSPKIWMSSWMIVHWTCAGTTLLVILEMLKTSKKICVFKKKKQWGSFFIEHCLSHISYPPSLIRTEAPFSIKYSKLQWKYPLGFKRSLYIVLYRQIIKSYSNKQVFICTKWRVLFQNAVFTCRKQWLLWNHLQTWNTKCKDSLIYNVCLVWKSHYKSWVDPLASHTNTQNPVFKQLQGLINAKSEYIIFWSRTPHVLIYNVLYMVQH